jgi:hypothetical protein
MCNHFKFNPSSFTDVNLYQTYGNIHTSLISYVVCKEPFSYYFEKPSVLPLNAEQAYKALVVIFSGAHVSLT